MNYVQWGICAIIALLLIDFVATTIRRRKEERGVAALQRNARRLNKIRKIQKSTLLAPIVPV